jgi:predicted nuclease of predicted toxin-antitoxin system
MKLLFDQNLSPTLVEHLSDTYPNSAHVHHLGLGEASDLAVWEFALQNAFTVVSKDADFVELSTVRGFPPKLLWLRIGNCVTRDIEQVIRRNRLSIAAFETDNARGVLALFRKGPR